LGLDFEPSLGLDLEASLDLDLKAFGSITETRGVEEDDISRAGDS
jgi:hypothetical protein